jgi:hypothetical protein
MIRKSVSAVLFAAVLFLTAACGSSQTTQEQAAEDTTANTNATEEEANEYPALGEDQYVFFVNLKDGDVVKSPFKVEMGVNGMEVEPAGNLTKNKGHHHILVNRAHYERGEIIPMDEINIHFGKGQTETELTLAPGKYTLTLQFADGYHQSYGPQMSKSIRIEVQE